MGVVDTVGNFKGESYPCLGCGHPVTLYFNGGECDRRRCCGYEYETFVSRIDLVVRDVDKDRAGHRGGAHE